VCAHPQAVKSIGFTTYSDSVDISNIWISRTSEGFSGPYALNLAAFGLYQAAWLTDAIPAGRFVGALSVSWEQTHPEANVVLGTTTVFGGAGAPQSYLLTLNGWDNTKSCISHHAGWQDGGEACDLGNGYTAPSSAPHPGQLPVLAHL
jgi:hypothetical protein